MNKNLIKKDRILSLLLCGSAIVGSAVGYWKIWLFHIVFLAFIYRNGLNTIRYVNVLVSKQVTGALLKIILAFFGWYFLSGMWTPNLWYWSRYIGYLIIGVGLVFAVVTGARSIDAYTEHMKMIKIIGFLALFIGLIEAFTSFRLPTSPYSDYAEYFGREGIDFSKLNESSIIFLKSSPTSFWANPNNFALFAAVISPYFMLHRSRMVGFLGLAVVLISLVMASSRGVLVGFLAGIIVCLFFLRYSHILALFLAILCVLLLAPMLDGRIYEDAPRLASMAYVASDVGQYFLSADEPSSSIDTRRQLIKIGILSFWESGGIGVGAGGTQSVLESMAGGVTSMHNIWIEILTDGGIVGFLLIILFVSTCTVNLVNMCRLPSTSFYGYQARLLLLSLFIFVIACISASSVIYFLPMWVLLGMTVSLIDLRRSTEEVS